MLFNCFPIWQLRKDVMIDGPHPLISKTKLTYSYRLYRVSQTDVYTLWNVISEQRNETEIQFVLCMIQNALEKNSSTFIVLNVLKQIWRWNYLSMNVSCYWSAIGKWRMLLKFIEVFSFCIFHKVWLTKFFLCFQNAFQKYGYLVFF